MLFNSIEFLLFLPIIMILFKNIKYKRVLVLLASYFFYMYWNPYYILLILGSTLADYFISLRLNSSESRISKKLLLFLSVFLNLSLLFIFKYYNFFVLEVLDRSDILSNFLLPVGISFYTFQTMSYTIDVYLKKIEPEKSLLDFALYVCYFPQLVAGPIEKAGRLLPQIKKLDNSKLNFDHIVSQKIFLGLFKKLIVADRIEVFVSHIYNNPNATSLDLIIAIYLFCFQIYCDFSGYCDIAVGVSRIFGIELMENFNRPYFSRSIKEFWDRWHISLSRWFQEYLYIPLGGSRISSFRTYINLIVVFLVSGLWHGANWNFVVWGGINAFYLVSSRPLARINNLLPNVLRYFITFHLVAFAWIFFRLDSISAVSKVIQKVFEFDFSSMDVGGSIYDLSLGVLFIACLFAYEFSQEFSSKKIHLDQMFKRWEFNYVALIFLISFSVFTSTNFIYFQF